jgi:hypothetical protein
MSPPQDGSRRHRAVHVQAALVLFDVQELHWTKPPRSKRRALPNSGTFAR